MTIPLTLTFSGAAAAGLAPADVARVEAAFLDAAAAWATVIDPHPGAVLDLDVRLVRVRRLACSE